MRSPIASVKRPRKDSSSTIASYEAEEQINHHNKMIDMQNSNAKASSLMPPNFLSRNQVNLNVINSSGVKIGGTTNIYNNCFSQGIFQK